MTSRKIAADSPTETTLTFGGRSYVLRSQHVSKADADPEFKWPAMIVAVGDSEDGRLIVEEIKPANADVAAAIAGDAMGRRLHRFERIGDIYFRDLKGVKYRGWKIDGTAIELETSKITSADIKWIKQYRETEKLYEECRKIDALAGTPKHQPALELFNLRHR